MNESAVFKAIAGALAVDESEINAGTTAADIPTWDSLGTMTVLVTLERDFGLKLEPGQTGRLRSVRGILELLAEQGAA